jgi:hypothetical protein
VTLAPAPRSRRATIALYGDPTRGGLFSCVDEDHADPEWRKACVVELHGDSAIAEVPAGLYFHTHRLLVDEVREAFRAARLACPEHLIRKAASWVPRHMRHDTPEKAAAEGRPVLPLSVHTFGAAVDVNSDQNEGRYFAHREVPEPFSKEWRDAWPAGLPEAYVRAWTSRGWNWGGDWGHVVDHRGVAFIDPMHFQRGA